MISEVYNMDCLEYMKGIPDKFFDLCIADPPYGINAANMQMGNGKRKWAKGKKWDLKIPVDDVFEQMFRVSKHTIIFGGNYFDLPPTRCVIVWDKKMRGMSFSDGELAWTNFEKPLRIIEISNNGSQINHEIKIHPTQKPIALYCWILDNYANGGG